MAFVTRKLMMLQVLVAAVLLPGGGAMRLLNPEAQGKVRVPEASVAEVSEEQGVEAKQDQVAIAAAAVELGSNASLADDSGGSPRETVNKFCDVNGLAEMHGARAQDIAYASQNSLESAILSDVARELESNNIDKVAKDVFSFYVCVRWAPDESFWKLAAQELASGLITSLIDHSQNLDQAIAELYQSFKYVPMLCSRNLQVFEETDNTDHTYFHTFKQRVEKLAAWIGKSGASPVGARLTQIDQVFCGDSAMNSKACHVGLDVKEWWNKVTSVLGPFASKYETRKDKWLMLSDLFQSFKLGGGAEWDADFSSWKANFPYHSFVDKPGGMPTDRSPKADERFVVCFGKRVASELHRRPGGQHILTDQNNVGCHGWWNAQQASQMLGRIVQLWKPPTCQMAGMAYIVKRQLLSMFAKMNEQLFDALPGLLNDELLNEDAASASENHWETTLPKPFDRKAVTVEGQEFVDAMRVRAKDSLRFPASCDFDCALKVSQGELGIAQIADGKLTVVWDKDDRRTTYPVSPTQVVIMPAGWKSNKGFIGHVKDLVAGIGEITDKAKAMFDAMFQPKYTGLAELMSNSVSKWAVCPVKSNVNLEDLDSELRVEDAAFQDFQKEAYAKWTGYKADIPGEKCVDAKEYVGPEFAECQVCEISELLADHLEKYYRDDGSQENFICPLRPPLPPDEQLAVLGQKRDSCLLRMTGEQSRQYSWHYQGRFPSRRQNDRKENIPKTEFELLKLLKVARGDQETEVTFGRHCSLEELQKAPRFCKLAKVENPWSTLAEFAQNLQEAAVGSLGLGATALASSIRTYQTGLRETKASEVALAIGEKLWAGLTGAGRLVKTASQRAASTATDGIVGSDRRKDKLEEQILGRGTSGLLLHELSYQRSIGSDKHTSNSQDRFQRYVVSCPCKGFDPALEFALRRRWGEVVLRMVKEAKKVRGIESLQKPSLNLLIRGEARLFERKNDRTDNNRWFEYGAAMQWVDGSSNSGVTAAPPKCYWSFGCKPEHLCEWSTLSCQPKMQWSSNGWWSVLDTQLAVAVGGQRVSVGQAALEDLAGLRLSVTCGPKKAYGPSGGPTTSGEALLQCLQKGVQTNARLRAKEPWRLYFPDEVVVVATFTDIAGRRCQPSADADQTLVGMLCPGAKQEAALDAHIAPDDKKSGTSVKYMGIFSGAGYARGTLTEVILRPEDVLEVLDLLG